MALHFLHSVGCIVDDETCMITSIGIDWDEEAEASLIAGKIPRIHINDLPPEWWFNLSDNDKQKLRSIATLLDHQSRLRGDT